MHTLNGDKDKIASSNEYFTEADDDDEPFPRLRCDDDDEDMDTAAPVTDTDKKTTDEQQPHDEQSQDAKSDKKRTSDDDDDDDEDADDDTDYEMSNADRKEVYESDSIVRIQPAVAPKTSTTKNKPSGNKSRNKMPKAPVQRRQTIDSMDLRQLVLRNNTNSDIRSKLMQSFSLNKNQIVIDYNILAFMENRDLEDDAAMEARMKKFISAFKKNYKGVQHIEYKIDNKLYCAIDIVYFLPILFNKFENKELSQLNRKTLNDIVRRLDTLSAKITGKPVPSSARSAKQSQVEKSPTAAASSSVFAGKSPISETDEEDEDEEMNGGSKDAAPASKAKKATSTSNAGTNDRNIRLYAIGNDFYMMCRKRQNFVDGQKNLEKKYGKCCRLIKTWNNRTDVKDIGKSILVKFPHMKWNARTNILTNSKSKPVSEGDLLNYLVKVIK